MSQVAHARGCAMRFPLVRNTLRTSSARRHDDEPGTPPAVCVSPEQDDAQLVAAARSGVNDAFEFLFRRYQAKVLTVAWRFTRKREDAEDIAQQAFQKAFLHIRHFQGSSSFSTWLTRIAINEALMYQRRRRASAEVSLEVSNGNIDTSMLVDPTECALNPEETCLQRETQRLVSAAVNSLRPKLRCAIQLRELAELSTEETAGLLNVSIGAVKARVFQGRRKLCGILKRRMKSTRHGHRAPEYEASVRITSDLFAGGLQKNASASRSISPSRKYS